MIVSDASFKPVTTVVSRVWLHLTKKNTKNTCGDHCQFDWQRFPEPILFTQSTVLPSVRPRFILRRWSADATSNSYSQLRCDVIGSSITCILVTTCILVFARNWNANSPTFTCTETREETSCGTAINTVSIPGTKIRKKKTRTHLELGGNVDCSEQEHEEAHHRFGTYRCPFFPMDSAS